jgi:(1->4)-alpha-D-glucan 1-alpha-D-glucosylmutase
MMPPSIPIATYRLQLTPSFGFDQAAALVPYLKALGVSHLYASPFLKARAGSSHGYDIVDHDAFNPELGGEQGFRRLREALDRADLGLVLDFVPNHMAVHHADNAWWLAVLEWGRQSPYAGYFDIDWTTLSGRPRGGVLLPILGRPYWEALEHGEIELRYDPAQGGFSAWYYQHRLPIAPQGYGDILRKLVAAAGAGSEPVGRRLLELAARCQGPRYLTRDQAAALKRELKAIAGAGAVIERGLEVYRPKSAHGLGAAAALHHLLERQHYRLAHWRLAGSEINYRRFFDINSLAGLRIENPATFEAVHRLVGRLISQGDLQGLRLDHIDGLYDPAQYLERLHRLIEADGSRCPGAFYVIVEKILADGERTPRFRDVAGTTGYEWLNLISRVLLDQRGLDALGQTWREASGDERSFEHVLIEAKRCVLSTLLASELNALARLLARIAAGHYSTRDYAAARLRTALELFLLHFPVYRTYVTTTATSSDDRAIIDASIGRVRAASSGPDVALFDFLRDALTLDLIAPGRRRHSVVRVRRFAGKVQQLTGPLMAKSLEDTAFYRYHRLLALNEVGGDPASGAVSAADFHNRMRARAESFPHGLTATATHDTKRGEDARARLLCLSELAPEWDEAVRHWQSLNAPLIETAGGSRIPSRAHEYMLYQALLGAWPLEGVDASFVERMQDYAVKAAREGKEQTNWLDPDQRYERGLREFLHRLLDPRESQMFIEAFDRFARRVALMGALKSLAQVVLKATVPGVPDFYQGTELWDLSLVDPDNRRPVDFERRASMLASPGSEPDWQALPESWPDGRIKLALTDRLLALRRELPALFQDGAYAPIEVRGPHANEILAFARVSGRDAVIVVVGRFFGRATEQGRRWPSADAWHASVALEGFAPVHNMLEAGSAEADAAVPVSRLFGAVPVALLRARAANRATKKAVRDLGPDGLADVVPTDQGSVPSLR